MVTCEMGKAQGACISPRLTFPLRQAYYLPCHRGKEKQLIQKDRASNSNSTVDTKEREMKKLASILLASFVLASSTALAQFSAGMSGAGLESAVKAQMAAGKSAADIAKAALAAGVNAGAVTTALLVSAANPDAAVQA